MRSHSIQLCMRLMNFYSLIYLWYYDNLYIRMYIYIYVYWVWVYIYVCYVCTFLQAARKEIAMIKVVAPQMAQLVIDRAIQVIKYYTTRIAHTKIHIQLAECLSEKIFMIQQPYKQWLHRQDIIGYYLYMCIKLLLTGGRNQWK